MNPQIRAVRAAERQLRPLPPALLGILRAASVAGRLEPALDWAEAAPFDALGALAGGANGRDTGQADSRRGSAPLLAASTRTTRPAEVAQAALAGARSAAEALGAAAARGARAAELPGSPGRSTIAEALSGSAQGAAASGEGPRPVFSLGALARRGAAALAPEGVAGRDRVSPAPGGGGAIAAALSGGVVAGSGAALAVAEGVVSAGLQAAARAAEAADAVLPAAGDAAGAAEALAPAIDGIRRRLGVAAARAAETRAAAQAAAERGAGRTAKSAQLAAQAAAATRAVSDLSPSELASNPPPSLPGQIEAAAVSSAGRDNGSASQAIAADWVVAVVGDALLEQARRQGVDLT